MRARVMLIGYCLALAAVHGVVALWTPIQGEDWGHWVWASEYDGIGTWLGAHFTFSDAAAYVLARFAVCHVVFTPLFVVALVVGLFTVATKRLPRSTHSDLLGISLASTLIWVVQPRAGVTLFHISNVALYVYGAALAVWFVAPLRCAWNVPRWAWPAYALTGYCVGTSSRAIATAVLIGFTIAHFRKPRRWTWIGIGPLLVGTIVGYVDPPWLAIRTVVRRGLDRNLEMLNLPVQEAGRAVSVVLALLLAYGLLAMFRGERTEGDVRPSATDTLCWLIASFAVSVFCLFGPRYTEATLLPVSCMVVISAIPWLLWLSRSRPIRFAIIGFVIAIHAVVWPTALLRYHLYGVEGRDRWARLAETENGFATLEPYSQIKPTFWFFGEDMASAASRQLIGFEVFGLRGIDLSPIFRNFEPDPDIQVHLEVEGIPESEQVAAGRPEQWGSVPSVARGQFARFVKALRARTDRVVLARLLVTNIDFPQRAGRPLVAAWARGDELVVPHVSRSRDYANDNYRIKIYPPDDARFDEAWIVTHGTAGRMMYRAGFARVQPRGRDQSAIVLCNATLCLVADALVPRL